MYAIDTLEFAKKLRTAGFSQEQAETIAEAYGTAFREAAEHTLATKSDLQALRSEFKQEILELKSELKQDIVEQGRQLMLSLGGMIAVAIAFLALIKFFA